MPWLHGFVVACGSGFESHLCFFQFLLLILKLYLMLGWEKDEKTRMVREWAIFFKKKTIQIKRVLKLLDR